MKICFSWLKKILEDAERVGSCVAFLVCVLVPAGALAFLCSVKFFLPAQDASATQERVPARIVIRLENFISVEDAAETENAPEEEPSEPMPPQPLPEQESPQEERLIEKIDETALRETLAEELPPLPPPESKVAAEPVPDRKEQASPPADSTPNAVDAEAKAAAKETLYGALSEAISRKRFYPKAARRNGRTGTVFLRVEIGLTGEITHYSLEKSSAHATLVSGALETMRCVAKDFFAPENSRAALPGAFVVPVVYELQ